MTAPSAQAAGSDLVLDRLSALHPKLIDLSLDRITDLLARLDDPHLSLPPVVHVAGTNGKGSLIAFLRGALEAARHSVHVYTSPHLVRFHERIRLAGRLIPEPRLLALLERCETANGGRPITYFEITTAAAFLAFAETPADVLLLETGLGGRLDATNMVPSPRVTAITPVSMDHQQFLGDTLPEIAGEKAGILKPGVPGIIGPQQPDALAVIEARAAEIGAPLTVCGRDWTAMPFAEGLAFTGRRTVAVPRLGLLGPHQVDNAGAAIAVLDALEAAGGPAVPDAVLPVGLAAARWPGRLHPVPDGALAAQLPEGWSLWVDGGHNPSAGAALAATLDEAAPLELIVGMIDTKDPEGFLRPLVSVARGVAAVPVPGSRAGLPPGRVAEAARRVGMPRVDIADDLMAATRVILGRADASAPARILICGSLYLVGTVPGLTVDA